MLEHIAQFTTWPILIGVIIGYIANRIMSGEDKDLILGIAGSNAGAFISNLLNVDLFGVGYIKNFIFCVDGSIAVLWVWKKLFD